MTPPTAPSVGFITLGCPKNEVDTDRMRARIEASSFTVADDLENADVIVVNTCSFIEAATEESVQTVLDLAAQWIPEREGRKLIVAGCMPSRYGTDLAQAMPEADAFLPVTDESTLLDVIERVTGYSAGKGIEGCAQRTSSGASAYLQVSDGCHRKCAYCTIPSIRGPYRSRELADVVAEAEQLVGLGAREIVLIGQDVTAWGRDLPDAGRFSDVVRAVAAVPGVRWVRIMYAQPDGVTDDLLAAMAENDNVCHYLDMPLQHASKPILRAMRRSGDSASYLKLIGRIRAAMPDVVLRTTVITGFPGETRADVRELEAFLTEANFDYVGVFSYSAEEGTEAAAMDAQVPVRTRRARAQRIRDLSDAIGFDKVDQRFETVLEVLVEGVDEDEGMVMGRHRGQAPDIDGVVLLDRGEPGDVVSTRMVDVLGYDLEGEVIG